MLYEIFKSIRQELADFIPCPPISCREAWQALDRQWLEGTAALGESFLGRPYPCLSAAEFMEFTVSGNRTLFEDKYFDKRRMLNGLVLAECAEDKGRFLRDIVNGIFSICEESSWCLPAHNSYIRDTPQLPLPDASEPVLDLFACETGALLATVSYLMRDRLDAVSPFISKRIFSELTHRIFTPYLNRHFWWMGNGLEPMNNWTAWCTQNVLLSVFLTDTSQKLRQQVLGKACLSADYFLAEYGEDGCCDEGAQYYRHAALCLSQILEIANAVTGQAFQELYGVPKIRNMAAYIQNVHIQGEYYVNFADCSPIAGPAGTREFLFAKRIGDQDLADFAAMEFCSGGRDSLLIPQEINLYYRLLNGFTASSIKYQESLRKGPVRHADIYYPSAGLFLARDDRLCLAVKAGDNGDSHNHNDTGSFTIYKDGLPLFIDAGVGSYTKDTFSPRRYEIWTMQSAFHNLPTFHGVMQSPGEDFGASDVCWHLGQEECSIQMELAGAYPPEAGLRSCHRQARLLKGQRIIIQDTYRMDSSADAQDILLSLMTAQLPVLSPSADTASNRRLMIGDLGILELICGRYLRTETIPITDIRLSRTWGSQIFRTLVAPEGGAIELHIY